MLNYSPASERNQLPIAERLLPWLELSIIDVLEIGSGSGQHALHLSQHKPHLQWQCSEMPANFAALQHNLHGQALPAPITLDVLGEWPEQTFDLLYSANTLHIMGWDAVTALFAGAKGVVRAGGLLVVYGPFCYDGQFTAPSNAAFDAMLRTRNPASGIRDFEAVNQLAEHAGFVLQQDYAMPANNQLLVWCKQTEALVP